MLEFWVFFRFLKKNEILLSWLGSFDTLLGFLNYWFCWLLSWNKKPVSYCYHLRNYGCFCVLGVNLPNVMLLRLMSYIINSVKPSSRCHFYGCCVLSCFGCHICEMCISSFLQNLHVIQSINF